MGLDDVAKYGVRNVEITVVKSRFPKTEILDGTVTLLPKMKLYYERKPLDRTNRMGKV